MKIPGFSEYREYLKRQSEQNQSVKPKETIKEEGNKAFKKNPSAYNEKQLQRTEREIEKLEGKLKEIEILYEEHSANFQKLMELDVQKAKIQEELDALYQKWEEQAE